MNLKRRCGRRPLNAAYVSYAFVVLVVMPLPWAADADDSAATWPQWRGPTRDAMVDGSEAWPDNLAGIELTWRVDLGPSYSGPIVASDRVFVTETVDKRKEVVRALDRATGEQLWEAGWSGAMKVPFFARSNGSWIRATPAYDGASLFVAGMRDVLVSLDAETGRERWRVDFVERHSTSLPSFGFVSSPLVDGDDLYVQAAASVMKLDKRDGRVIWRTLEERGGMMASAFSSPVLATIRGVRQLVVQTRQELAGVDPKTGAVLWHQRVPAYRGMNILTPTVFENSIFTSTYKNATFLYDINHGDDGWSVAQNWTDKARGYMSSPVLIGNYGYLHLGNGRLACFDLRDGRQTWRSKSLGKYWSMASDGRKILALNEVGELLLIGADPTEFMLLDRRSISEQETWGHVALAGNEIFVRELQGLSALHWKDLDKTPAEISAGNGTHVQYQDER